MINQTRLKMALNGRFLADQDKILKIDVEEIDYTMPQTNFEMDRLLENASKIATEYRKFYE